MALPPEKISELKQIIRQHLSQLDIQTHLKDAMQNDNFSEENVLNALRNKGVLEDIMRNLHFDTTNDEDLPAMIGENPKKRATHFYDKEEQLLAADSVHKANIDPTRRYLYFQVLSGKAFLEHLQDNQSSPSGCASFTLQVHFRGQRFKSRPVPCACEPAFQEGFMLELHKESSGDAARMVDNTAMLGLSDPVHLVLTKTDSSGATHLVSSYFLQWRTVLAATGSKMSVSAELKGVGAEHQVLVGVLELKLELLPKVNEPLSEQIVSTQLAMEKSRHAERERLFLVYAKQWWKEYLQIRPGHEHRYVKIFAQDENFCGHPVVAYIHPLRAGRLLKTARQAARFVSLIAYEKVAPLGGGKAEQWCTPFAFLCRNRGDCEDHAILLCNLLLGFGLDAYVCVGHKVKGEAHAWVMTIGTDGLVTFWESLTGHRYLHQPINPDDPPSVPQPKQRHPYKSIGSVFNHESFFANCQPSELVELCVFDLYNQSRWKPMSADALRSIKEGLNPNLPPLPPLSANTLDPALASNDLEVQLRHLIVEHRRDQGLGTTWDDHLSYLLTPALAAYENERLTGRSVGNEEFQDAIRRCVPDGHTFKGFPIQLVQRNPRVAFYTCVQSPVGEEIINCKGDHVRLAIRVEVVTYPENTTAVWVMLACKYKAIL